MRWRTAALALRLPLARNSERLDRALRTVMSSAAHADEGAVGRAAVRAMKVHGPEAVWRAWLEPSVSGPSPRRWTSPLLADLLDSAAQVPDVLVDSAWQDWLDEHDPHLWSLLRHWNRAATTCDHRVRFLSRLALDEADGRVDAQALADAAARFDHPLGERARARMAACGDDRAVDLFCTAAVDSPDATAFCAEHQLAPSDRVERAVFFVRTGQYEQYRALDPDGALLGLGYRAVSSEVRRAIREAMTVLNGIETLRVLAGQRAEGPGFVSLSADERTYLSEKLACQGDWERLWRLVLLMPLSQAVDTVQAFDAWRPSGEDDRRVFEELRAAEPRTVRDQVEFLSGPSPRAGPGTWIRLRELDERATAVFDVDFAPDGEELAFAGISRWAGVIELGNTTMPWLYPDFTGSVTGVAHLGSDAIVVAESGEEWNRHRDPRATRLRYVDHRGGRELSFPTTPISRIRSVKRIAGDRRFVALSARERGRAEEWMLLAGRAGGAVTDSGVLHGMTYLNPTVAVDPGGRLVSVVDRRAALVADLGDSRVNVLDGREPQAGDSRPCAALSPSVLVRGLPEGYVHVWHEPMTSTEPPMEGRLWPEPESWRDWLRTRTLIDLAWSPALRRFLALSQERTDGRESLFVEILDIPALRDTPLPLPQSLVSESFKIDLPMNGHHPFMRLSPKGDVLAVGGGPTPVIQLQALSALSLRPFVDTPMGLMTHEQFKEVVAVLQNPLLGERSRATLTLLRTCLEQRFGGDIGIGGPASVSGDAIALGRDGTE
ncbi:hypothetical protein [Streptomyces lanatus]|uniref:Uncharacterized protein n=1 Tax=Streptomyces lanatus TaxID=66900 RepID=A0ABV1XLF7_9ACTN|nr:hypothetical protein [Streptomyces lanatus]GHG98836.1 hypothetical protein GCM10018780_24960 [Streptomyces lanatus]